MIVNQKQIIDKISLIADLVQLIDWTFCINQLNYYKVSPLEALKEPTQVELTQIELEVE